MSIICDPNCIGDLMKCCVVTQWPMGLMPLPWSLRMFGRVLFLYAYYFLKDVPKGFLCLFIATIISLPLIWLYERIITLYNRLKPF